MYSDSDFEKKANTFAQGKSAAMQSKSQGDNPYPVSSEEFKTWKMGWLAGDKEKKNPVKEDTEMENNTELQEAKKDALDVVYNDSNLTSYLEDLEFVPANEDFESEYSPESDSPEVAYTTINVAVIKDGDKTVFEVLVNPATQEDAEGEEVPSDEEMPAEEVPPSDEEMPAEEEVEEEPNLAMEAYMSAISEHVRKF